MAQPACDDQANGDEFAREVEPFRAEIRLHCYRMLGSLEDAEDLTQETMLRAWQRRCTFEGRGTLRAWLYKIATNACLDALKKLPRKSLPAVTHEAADPGDPVVPPPADPIWLEPFPDDLLADVTPSREASPEAQYTLSESVRLAFLVALQTLPPRQRAALILCDVLDWRAAEAADLLGASVGALNGALHRARSALRARYHGDGIDDVRVASEAAVQSALNSYVKAWESSDVAALVALLTEKATFTMPPSPSWYRGKADIQAFVERVVMGDKSENTWRVRLTSANGQPAAGLYRRSPVTGAFSAYALQMLTLDGERIADVITFMKPALVGRFGLPPEVEG